MKEKRQEERGPRSGDRSFLIGLAIGIAVPCAIAYLIDRMGREAEEEYPKGDPFLLYDDGSLEPELIEEHLFRRTI